MGAADQAGVFERVVEAARRAASHDDVWTLLAAVANARPDATGPAFDGFRSEDAFVRATACHLVGLICERHQDPREPAVEHLLDLVAAESNADVLWSASRALGAAATPRAIPALLALAHHADEDVRLQVALALPASVVEHLEPAAIQALIELTRDVDAEVRNWATFGLGRQLDFDSVPLRDALWERVADESQDVREEAIAGLARRRDPRALPLVAELLDSGDVPTWLFDAAASLADGSLVPALLHYDETDELVRRALSWCDPESRAARERSIAALVDETQRLLDERSPGAVVVARCDVLDADVLMSVRLDDGERLGAADHILAAAGDDPVAAARRWVGVVTGAAEDSSH